MHDMDGMKRGMEMSYYLNKILNSSFEETIKKVLEELKRRDLA